ncbi:MAG: hypothetical protein LBE13_03370 [Bacteroidales bacterium]|jgi:2-phosphoglycerate kinase|nr:hypothetical protein [Bacteroidales bacterium]
MKHNKFIFIAAGSFQGKSLVALKLASIYNFSGVLTTDMIRNLYTINCFENKIYSTSTYLMEKKDFEEQRKIVSETLLKMMNIYEARGEKMIFEGLHFSDTFIKTIKDTPYLKIFLNNLLTPAERYKYKKKTRSKFNVEFKSNKNQLEYENTLYYKYEARIIEIHENLKNTCLKNGFIIINYINLDEAINECKKLVDKYLLC